MKDRRLLRAFGQIDDAFIEEALPKSNSLETRKVNKRNFYFPRPAAAAAAVAICICALGTTVLALPEDLRGYFKDICRWDGAVVGTAYDQATDEMNLDVLEVGDELLVGVTMVYPDQYPYREIERLGIANYEIVNEKTSVVAEGTTETAELHGGMAVISISLEGVPEGKYRLLVSKMTGEKTAEQPLQISGKWECAFTK